MKRHLLVIVGLALVVALAVGMTACSSAEPGSTHVTVYHGYGYGPGWGYGWGGSSLPPGGVIAGPPIAVPYY